MTSPCIYPCERCNITITAWNDENPLCQKCDMIKQKEHEQRKIHSHGNAEYLIGRSLENAIYSTKGKCSDCGKMSKFLIIEKQMTKKEREDVLVHVGNLEDMKAWYWCGMCLVG